MIYGVPDFVDPAFGVMQKKCCLMTKKRLYHKIMNLKTRKQLTYMHLYPNAINF
jgi:hypothetical protein